MVDALAKREDEDGVSIGKSEKVVSYADQMTLTSKEVEASNGWTTVLSHNVNFPLHNRPALGCHALSEGDLNFFKADRYCKDGDADGHCAGELNSMVYKWMWKKQQRRWFEITKLGFTHAKSSPWTIFEGPKSPMVQRGSKGDPYAPDISLGPSWINGGTISASGGFMPVQPPSGFKEAAGETPLLRRNSHH
jgi:hypothetical protein